MYTRQRERALGNDSSVRSFESGGSRIIHRWRVTLPESTTRAAAMSATSAPYTGDRCGARSMAERLESVHILDRAQHGIVIGSFAGIAVNQVGAGEHHRYLVGLGKIVFIPGKNEQAVVRPRPLDVGVQIFLQPKIAGGNGAIVQVVAQIRYDDGY